MNILNRQTALALAFTALSGATLLAHAAAPATGAEATAKPIVQTSCQEYVGMNESFKPKFIYFAVGHGKHGAREAVIDEVGIEKIKPELDEYCKVHLDKSAYQQVIASSMASEHAAHKVPAKSMTKTAAKAEMKAPAKDAVKTP